MYTSLLTIRDVLTAFRIDQYQASLVEALIQNYPELALKILLAEEYINTAHRPTENAAFINIMREAYLG